MAAGVAHVRKVLDHASSTMPYRSRTFWASTSSFHTAFIAFPANGNRDLIDPDKQMTGDGLDRSGGWHTHQTVAT